MTKNEYQQQFKRMGTVSCSQLYYKEQILLKYINLREDSVNEHFIAAVTGVSMLQKTEETMPEATHCDLAHITTALSLNFIIHKIKGFNQKTSKVPLKISSEIYV